jgi:opacity protein-like surface antigen
MSMKLPRTSTRPKPGTLIASAAAIAALLLVSLTAGAGLAQASGGVGTGSGGHGGSDSSGSRHSDSTYTRLWDGTSHRNKRWARKTARCESGGNPNAIGGGGRYRGAFQFMKSTWRTSPKSPGGDPIDYSYRTQAVVAVKLKQRDGAGHWPVCG